MPLPEGYLPREGDVLVVHAVTKYTVDPGDDQVHITLTGRYSSISMDLTDIVGLYCRKWNEGDKVVHQSLICEVIATHGDMVWLKMPNREPLTAHANDVQAAPVDPVDLPFVDPPASPELPTEWPSAPGGPISGTDDDIKF